MKNKKLNEKSEMGLKIFRNWDVFLLLISVALLIVLKEIVFLYSFAIFLAVLFIRNIFNRKSRRSIFRWILFALSSIFLIIAFYLYIILSIIIGIGGAG